MKYPIGIQTFETIIEDNYLYVDKTKSLYDLISQGKVYFLSRPRRFGKSLFISTLSAFFEGKKQLFKGLYIEDKVEKWETYPVIHIAMSDMSLRSDKLQVSLLDMLNRIARQYGITLVSEGIGERFKELIETLSQRQKVVVLIDEYDKALINFIDETDIFEENRKILKSFYGVLKDCDKYLKFLFITGVSRFSKVSLFSDLNNLVDISMKPNYCDICGYTQADMQKYFDTRIAEIAENENITKEEMYEKIRQKYNGYNFNGKIKMYNPWSVLNFMQDGELINYWFETGTPYFLAKMASRFETNVEGAISSRMELGHLRFDDENLSTLLYQTGYLTIDEKLDVELFRLKHPNQEVSESFRWFLLSEFTRKGAGEMQYASRFIREALLLKDAERLKNTLNPFFAKIPYQIFIKDKEAYYHSILHLIFMLLRYQIDSEVVTNAGRIDSVIDNLNEIWIFECKLDETAEKAYQQIIEKKYAEQYKNTGKQIWGFGVNFNSEQKQVNEVVIRQII
ncbi:MAG: AAA family ATPase [Bacteroidia bacterium]